MNTYYSPEVEIIELEAVDVIETSGGLGSSEEGSFDDVFEWT